MEARGPFFEELHVGQVFDSAPEVTLTEGLAGAHQALAGCRLRLPLSAPLANRVLGRPVVHPALVWDLAIGHSSLVTHTVRANLLYRGLLLRRLPAPGDTLRTVTTIDALKQNSVRPGRPATGLAVLHIVTRDQDDRVVLDFRRCAMLPLGDASVDTGHHRPLGLVPADLADADLHAAVEGWALAAAAPVPGPGTVLEIRGGDVVSGAPELARLTLNIAMVHHDAAAASGERLVYGGHTIDLALLQASRAIPSLLTVLGWHSCDHLAPVHEGDLLTSSVAVERVDGPLVHLRSRVAANGTPVLDWRFVAVAG